MSDFIFRAAILMKSSSFSSSYVIPLKITEHVMALKWSAGSPNALASSACRSRRISSSAGCPIKCFRHSDGRFFRSDHRACHGLEMVGRLAECPGEFCLQESADLIIGRLPDKVLPPLRRQVLPI